MILNLFAWAAIVAQLITGIWLWRANSSDSRISPLPPTINHILTTAAGAVVLVLLLLTRHFSFPFWICALLVLSSSWQFFMKLTKR